MSLILTTAIEKGGTGKTTTVVKFIEAFLEIHPKGIIQMCAPTGKATSRLLESVKNQADAGPTSAPYYPEVRKAHAEGYGFIQRKTAVCG